ncbi:hypothetical protein SESBI_47013 [Sesbania bispinosa]|nr:hypothetical protein SESBI_47013 [Sesbania bispinosa]
MGVSPYCSYRRCVMGISPFAAHPPIMHHGVASVLAIAPTRTVVSATAPRLRYVTGTDGGLLPSMCALPVPLSFFPECEP